jgi:hypothetical protein
MLKIKSIESHANVVVLQEEIKFPNIKNHHVIKNLLTTCAITRAARWG